MKADPERGARVKAPAHLVALRARKRLRYHSPSSLEMAGDGVEEPGHGCRRAWALRYLRGLKKPEVSWEDAEHAAYGVLPPGSRSAALGTRVHQYAEWWLLDDAQIDAPGLWETLPGKVLHSMLPHLPPRGSFKREHIEVPWTLEVDGVRFRGKADVATEGEVHDHKTTRSIADWSLRCERVSQIIGGKSLRDNLQACIYALWSAWRGRATTPRPVTKCRWVYGETDRVRRSLPVVQDIPTTHARAVVGAWVPRAKELETYRAVEDAPANTLACFDYGGCWYRHAGYCSEPKDYGRIALWVERQEKEKDK